MNMEKALNQAMKGGWQRYKAKQPTIVAGLDMGGLWNVEDRDELFAMEDAYLIQEALLDPLFWQALGKAEGWKIHRIHLSGGVEMQYDFSYEKPEWLRHWNSLIDHLAEGKPIDEFFNNLLK